MMKHDGKALLVLFDFSDTPYSEGQIESFRNWPSLGRGNHRKSAFNVVYFFVENADRWHWGKSPKTSVSLNRELINEQKTVGLIDGSHNATCRSRAVHKTRAVLTLHPGQDNAEFNINASTGDGSGVCNMEGTAQQIAAGERQKRRWVWNDNTSQCVAVISEMKNGKASVMTRACEGYCGASAAGTMDGLFNKK